MGGALGTRDASFYFGIEEGAGNYVDLQHAEGQWGACVLEVMALSSGLVCLLPPRAALKTVTVAISGTAASVVSGGKGVAPLLDKKR